MGEGKRGKKWKQKGHKGPLRLNEGWSIFFFFWKELDTMYFQLHRLCDVVLVITNQICPCSTKIAIENI